MKKTLIGYLIDGSYVSAESIRHRTITGADYVQPLYSVEQISREAQKEADATVHTAAAAYCNKIGITKTKDPIGYANTINTFTAGATWNEKQNEL